MTIGRYGMFGFGKKKKEEQRIVYNAAEKYPAIRCSICTGEQVAGFRRRGNGAFEELMLIRDSRDYEAFCKMVGTEDIPKEF